MSDGKNLFIEISKAMAEAVARAEAATLLVDARQRLPASGVAYAPDLVLTADHVVERDEGISVMLPEGEQVSAQVAGRDPGSDLALLRLAEARATPAEAAGAEPRVGEMVLALGRPTPAGIEASLGVVSAANSALRSRRGGIIERHIRTDAIPLPGFSGGPLVSAGGQVLGLNTSGLFRGMLVSIPLGIAWKTAEALAEHGSIKRGYLGIRSELVEIPAAARESLGRKQATGLLLAYIADDSPAAESDLMVGDIIVGIAGSPVHDHDDLLGRLVGDVVGKPTPVEVLRGGQPQVVEVTVGEREPQGQHGKGHRWHRHGSRRRRHHR
jgi:S1-C subfamily serine protease